MIVFLLYPRKLCLCVCVCLWAVGRVGGGMSMSVRPLSFNPCEGVSNKETICMKC